MKEDEIVQALEALRETAPPTLEQKVLSALGLDLHRGRWDSPIGPVAVAWSDRGVVRIEPGAERADEPLPEPMRRALDDRMAGKRVRLKVDLRDVTDFERAVLEKAAEIPRGEVRPYGWIAREIGRPAAVRAVGSALGRNPVPLVIPCHRVVCTDGRIGQYALGTSAKRALLSGEGLDPDELERQAGAGVRYVGSDTTHIFCHPTCRNARRITGAHRVAFRTEAAAEAAGYRACLVCRPAA
jgi:O-6-methylguanine DNA methyltransferase